MRVVSRASLVVLLAVARPCVGAPPVAPATPERARLALHGLPLAIIPNVGQSATDIDFEVRGLGRDLAFTADSVVVGPDLRVRWVGASPDCRPEADAPLPGHVNFYFGDDPAGWRERVPTWSSVLYRGAWPGIDVSCGGGEGRLKTEFRVARGVDPSRIRVAWDGSSTSVRVQPDGSLLVETPSGCVVDEAPVAWQVVDGRREDVSARFVVAADGSVGFAVEGWTRGDLVIDPVLDFATWWGGSDADEVVFVLTISGETLIEGNTRSTDFPVLYPQQPAGAGGSDLFATQLTRAMDVSWSTYYGGSGDDVMVGRFAGWTTSSDFPSSTYIGPRGGRDGLLIEGFGAGGAFRNAAVIGGSGDDEFRDRMTDVASGTTTSTDLATLGGAWSDATLGGPSDAFVLMTDCPGAGCSIQAGTYLGGSGAETLGGVGLLDRVSATSDRVIAVGETSSPDFPLRLGGMDATLDGASDGFVSELDIVTRPGAEFVTLRAATYLGGSGSDALVTLGPALVGATEAVAVAGWTDSMDLPVVVPFQSTLAGGRDALLAVMRRDLSGLEVSTYLGGTEDDAATRIVPDFNPPTQWAIVGSTASDDFPTVNAFQAVNGGGDDAFYSHLVPHPSRSILRRSTYFGGSGDEAALDGQRIDSGADEGCVYLGGRTTSVDLPVARELQPGLAGGTDGFLARICEHQLSESGEAIDLGEIWARFEVIEGMASAIEAKLDTPPDHATLLAAVERTEAGVARVEAKLDAPPDHATILDEVRQARRDVAGVEAKLDALPDLAGIEPKIDALEAKLDAGASARDLDRLLKVEVMLHEQQCVPSLWLPAAQGGLLEAARAHVGDLVTRAEADGDPQANVRLARQKLAASDEAAARGLHEKACQSLSEALRAISPQ